MKNSFLIYLCSLAIALGAFGQTPSPSATATASPTATVSATPTATATARADDEDDIASSVRSKVRKHLGRVNVNGHSHDLDMDDVGTAGGIAVAIIGVIFTTLFGAPVLIVAAIMFFSYLKNRALHRTVREMVAKGQPVPPELFAPPGSPVKLRNDFRRGVILVTIGVGLMIFFGAVSDWESGGPWVIGVIPFLIGAAYLVLGKYEMNRRETNTLPDNTPPVP